MLRNRQWPLNATKYSVDFCLIHNASGHVVSDGNHGTKSMLL
jgi:hypothetical protein